MSLQHGTAPIYQNHCTRQSPVSSQAISSPGPIVPSYDNAKGTWFDPSLGIREPEGAATTNEMLRLISSVERRARKRRATDELNHYHLVRKILANGLRCHYHRSSPRVAYLRKAGSYLKGPAWISGESMARAVDLLVAAGLAENTVGKHGAIASTYAITPALCVIAAS